MTYQDEILADRQKAQDYATEYLGIVLTNMNAAGRVISGAMAKFAKFAELSDAKTVSYWKSAAHAIETDVPAFQFMRMLLEHERAIDKAMHSGSHHPSSKLKEKLEALENTPPAGITQLNTLDPSKEAIQELIQASQKALVVCAKTLHLIDLEVEKRLAHPDHRPAGAILARLEKFLPLPEYPSEAERDQIESACLWKMIRDWVSHNVFWLETIIMVPKVGASSDTFVRADTETSLEGINNNQVAMIAALFGHGVPRGKYFNAPAITYGWHALDYWGVSTRYRKVYRNQSAASGSL